MSFDRLEQIQRTIAQSNPLRSNNDERLQSKEMPSTTKTKTNKEDFTLLIRLKVRYDYHYFSFFCSNEK
jgi:hypothetical protein